MALNAETIGLLREELDRTLRDGRIEKIQQPEKDLLLLTVRARGENRKLLIRAAGPNARVHLTEQNFENPREAPMFCMLLRKYLTGARLLEVSQPEGDRLLVFSLEGRNELLDSVPMQLAVELLGRATNVVLVDGEGRILDCLRRVPPDERGGRALLPGLRYELPPRPENVRREREGGALSDGESGAAPTGAVPSTEPPASAEEGQAALPAAAEGFSPSAVLDARYAAMERQELQRRRAQELTKAVRRSRDRQQRKLLAQREELRRSENMEEVRRRAELLQANLYRVRRGDRTLVCENYYEPESPALEIPLDPLKTPQQNLAAAFREYRKLKGAREHLTSLTQEGEKQLDYLNSVLEELSRAESARDLDEIRLELEKTGLAAARRGKRTDRQKPGRKPKPAARRVGEPLRFETPDGLEALVGRTNTQNDALTLELARRTDYWFHVKNLHGSHVILRCEGLAPPEASLVFAAELAARYSQAAGSGKTAVDYCMVRDVKKPSGALPGKVIYVNYRTLVVES